jgi:hypothetical protein
MGPDRRTQLVAEMSEEIRQLTLDGLRDRNPEASDQELVLLLIEVWHGPDLAQKVRQFVSRC